MDENSDSDSDLDDLFSYLKSSRNKKSKDTSSTAFFEDDESEVPANESVAIANAETEENVQNECAIDITNKAENKLPENTGSTIENAGSTMPDPDNEESQTSQKRNNRYYLINETDWNAFCDKKEIDKFETVTPKKSAVDGTLLKDFGSQVDTKRKERSDVKNVKQALEYIAPKYRKEPLTMSHIETIIKSSPSKSTGLHKNVHFPNVDKEVESLLPRQASKQEKNEQGRSISPCSSPIEIVYVRVLEDENTTDKLCTDNDTQNESANQTKNDGLQNSLKGNEIVEPATKRAKLSSTLEQGVQYTQAPRRFIRKNNKLTSVLSIDGKEIEEEVIQTERKDVSEISQKKFENCDETDNGETMFYAQPIPAAHVPYIVNENDNLNECVSEDSLDDEAYADLAPIEIENMIKETDRLAEQLINISAEISADNSLDGDPVSCEAYENCPSQNVQEQPIVLQVTKSGDLVEYKKDDKILKSKSLSQNELGKSQSVTQNNARDGSVVNAFSNKDLPHHQSEINNMWTSLTPNSQSCNEGGLNIDVEEKFDTSAMIDKEMLDKIVNNLLSDKEGSIAESDNGDDNASRNKKAGCKKLKSGILNINRPAIRAATSKRKISLVENETTKPIKRKLGRPRKKVPDNIAFDSEDKTTDSNSQLNVTEDFKNTQNRNISKERVSCKSNTHSVIVQNKTENAFSSDKKDHHKSEIKNLWKSFKPSLTSKKIKKSEEGLNDAVEEPNDTSDLANKAVTEEIINDLQSDEESDDDNELTRYFDSSQKVKRQIELKTNDLKSPLTNDKPQYQSSTIPSYHEHINDKEEEYDGDNNGVDSKSVVEHEKKDDNFFYRSQGKSIASTSIQGADRERDKDGEEYDDDNDVDYKPEMEEDDSDYGDHDLGVEAKLKTVPIPTMKKSRIKVMRYREEVVETLKKPTRNSTIENDLDTEVYVVKYRYGSRIIKPDKLGDQLEQRYYNTCNSRALLTKKENNRVENEELSLDQKENVGHSSLTKISDCDIKVQNNNLEVEIKNEIADKSQKSTKIIGSETEPVYLDSEICNSSFIESSCKINSNVDAESSTTLNTSNQMQGNAVTEMELCAVRKSILKKKILLKKAITNRIAEKAITNRIVDKAITNRIAEGLKTKRFEKSKWPTKETVTKFKSGSNMVTQVRVSFDGTDALTCHESETHVERKTARPPCVQPGINRNNKNVNVSPFNNDPVADKTVRNEGIEPAVKRENNDNVIVEKFKPLNTIAKKSIQPNGSGKPNRSAEKSASKLTNSQEQDESERLKTLVENDTTKITKNKVGRPRKKLPDNIFAEQQNDTSAEISTAKSLEGDQVRGNFPIWNVKEQPNVKKEAKSGDLVKHKQTDEPLKSSNVSENEQIISQSVTLQNNARDRLTVKAFTGEDMEHHKTEISNMWKNLKPSLTPTKTSGSVDDLDIDEDESFGNSAMIDKVIVDAIVNDLLSDTEETIELTANNGSHGYFDALQKESEEKDLTSMRPEHDKSAISTATNKTDRKSPLVGSVTTKTVKRKVGRPKKYMSDEVTFDSKDKKTDSNSQLNVTEDFKNKKLNCRRVGRPKNSTTKNIRTKVGRPRNKLSPDYIQGKISKSKCNHKATGNKSPDVNKDIIRTSVINKTKQKRKSSNKKNEENNNSLIKSLAESPVKNVDKVKRVRLNKIIQEKFSPKKEEQSKQKLETDSTKEQKVVIKKTKTILKKSRSKNQVKFNISIENDVTNDSAKNLIKVKTKLNKNLNNQSPTDSTVKKKEKSTLFDKTTKKAKTPKSADIETKNSNEKPKPIRKRNHESQKTQSQNTELRLKRGRKSLKSSRHKLKTAMKKSIDNTWKEKLDDKAFGLNFDEVIHQERKPVNVRKLIRTILETPDSKEKREKRRKEHEDRKKRKTEERSRFESDGCGSEIVSDKRDSRTVVYVQGNRITTFSESDDAWLSDSGPSASFPAFSFPAIKTTNPENEMEVITLSDNHEEADVISLNTLNTSREISSLQNKTINKELSNSGQKLLEKVNENYYKGVDHTPGSVPKEKLTKCVELHHSPEKLIATAIESKLTIDVDAPNVSSQISPRNTVDRLKAFLASKGSLKNAVKNLNFAVDS